MKISETLKRNPYLKLIQNEGWEIREKPIYSDDGELVRIEHRVIVYDEEYPVTHPVMIHLKLYRDLPFGDLKYEHMKKARDYLWPNIIWHYWTERRFRAHCNGWKYIGWAGGANIGKSFDAAMIAVLFWLANPKKRGVIVASTTLESLSARVWGYVTKLLSSIEVPLAYKYVAEKPPKVLFPADIAAGKIKDTLHGIFCVAAKQGSDENAISSWIGRHPEDALFVVLDECTDLNPAIASSFTNLDSSARPFQITAIGNSNSINDLHGAICTPKEGWTSVNPLRDVMWETTYRDGICLFFSCYESPAIHETDPRRKKILSEFLFTQELIDRKKEELGETSERFWRFVIGFWKSGGSEPTAVTKEFLSVYGVTKKAEWSGLEPISYVGGLDIAFSTGGDKIILQLAMLGQDTDGRVILDFRGKKLRHEIRIERKPEDIAIQMAKQVQKILDDYGIALHNIAIDATGQGRAMGGTLQLQMNVPRGPIKIYTVRTGSNVDKSFDVVPRTNTDMYSDFKTFVQHDSIRGLDEIVIEQMTNRLMITDKQQKVRLESKAEYKKRMAARNPALAHSPDESDGCVLTLQAAMINFGFFAGQVRPLPQMPSGDFAKLRTYQTAKMQQGQYATVREMPKPNFKGNIYQVKKAKW